MIENVLPRVELLEVGEKWQALSGEFTCTAADLADARAAMDDPLIPAPIIKLGHRSILNNFGDGAPSFGRVINAGLTSDKHTLVGDYAGLTAWLTKAIPTAYGRRSIEGMKDVVTPSGRKYSLVITAVSLLGMAFPAISTLKDIQLAMTATDIDQLDLVEDPEAEVTPPYSLFPNSVKGPALPFKTVPDVAAAMTSDEVRDAFHDGVAAPSQWVRSVMVDPAQIIVTDESDKSLWRIDYSIDGEQVSFGEGVRVRVDYVDVPDVAASSGVSRETEYTKGDSRPANDWGNSRVWGPAARYVGLPEGSHFHDCRGVGATWAAQAGATTKELMVRLGHTTPNMAMRYQRAEAARDRAVADAMSALVTR